MSSQHWPAGPKVRASAGNGGRTTATKIEKGRQRESPGTVVQARRMEANQQFDAPAGVDGDEVVQTSSSLARREIDSKYRVTASYDSGRDSVPAQQRLLIPKGYTHRPVVPAEKYDVVSFAKAMNDDFAPRVQTLFKPEVEAALTAQKTGVYISWRLPDQKFDCQRVNDMSRCFCGHSLSGHEKYTGRSIRVPCAQPTCRCRAFEWIPSRPEDVGEFWYQRRRGFDPSSWRAKCRCKHSHEEHDAATSATYRRCLTTGCRCGSFESNFLCAACDKHWEEHQTFFENEEDRKRLGLPYGEAYLPFAEMPNLRNAALTGNETDDSVYTALLNGPSARPAIAAAPVGNHAVVPRNRTPAKMGFRPVYD